MLVWRAATSQTHCLILFYFSYLIEGEGVVRRTGPCPFWFKNIWLYVVEFKEML